jgi:hypothetical protein
MIILIDDRNELNKLHKRLLSKLEMFCDEEREVLIVHRPKQFPEKVSISNRLGIWWHHMKRNDHFWGPFGTLIPVAGKAAKITVNITYKHSGEPLSRGTSFFARNEEGEILLLHNGNIGGGKKNIGKKGFWQHYAASHEYILGDTKRTTPYAIVGNLDSPLFCNELAWFVKYVEYIKGVLSGDQTGLAGFEFRPEFHGKYTYNLPETVTVQSNHGLVVNELTKKLKSIGLSVGNTNKMDVFIYTPKTEKVTHLIEVKTKLSTQNLYSAVGQLFIYGLGLPKNCRKFLMAPKPIKAEIKNDLNQLGIEILAFEIADSIMFFNLKQLQSK